MTEFNEKYSEEQTDIPETSSGTVYLGACNAIDDKYSVTINGILHTLPGEPGDIIYDEASDTYKLFDKENKSWKTIESS